MRSGAFSRRGMPRQPTYLKPRQITRVRDGCASATRPLADAAACQGGLKHKKPPPRRRRLCCCARRSEIRKVSVIREIHEHVRSDFIAGYRKAQSRTTNKTGQRTLARG